MMNTQQVSEKDYHTFGVFNDKIEISEFQEVCDKDNILRNNIYMGGEILYSFHMSNNTVEIDAHTFFRRESLSEVTFSTSLQKIGNSAFEDCYDLNDVNLPPSVKSIGNLAFSRLGSTFHFHISTLEEFGKFVFGYHRELLPNIMCGYISTIEEGNKFPNLNCYERTCQMLLPLGDGNQIQLTLLYNMGKSIGEPPKWTMNGNINYEHPGFEGSQPEITFDRDIVQSSIIITNLSGETLTINGFFQQPEGEENFQALVNAQHPEMAGLKWSIAPNWLETPVKELTCLEVIQQIIIGKFDVTEPILYLYDE